MPACAEYIRSRDNSTRFPKEFVGNIDPSTVSKIELSDLVSGTFYACVFI